jgi:sugar phosphate isomerase/epimerase
LFGKTERLFHSEEERRRLLNYTKKAIDFASSINCTNLVFGSPKNRIIESDSQMHLAISFFKELGEYACKKKTTVSIEANPAIYGTNFINNTKQALSLVKQVGSSGFMVNLDLGTIIQNNEKLEDIVDSLNLINHIHISEPQLVAIKERALHVKLAAELKKADYNKYVSIETKNTDSLEEIKSSISYLKKIFR